MKGYFGVPYPLMIGFSIPRKFSPRNGHFLPICESFLPRKFPAIQYCTCMIFIPVYSDLETITEVRIVYHVCDALCEDGVDIEEFSHPFW